MEFKDRLDKIWDRISDEDFLANRGVANEVRYYVFDYEPCDELIMREKTKALKKQNNPDADGFQIVEYDLYELVIGILEEKDIWISALNLRMQREWNMYIQLFPRCSDLPTMTISL